jgi:hypothetical protein
MTDVNVRPNRDVPLWNETRWNGCWNGADGVGIYLHAGRFRFDLDIWWAQVVAYLPDGVLCVNKLWGPNSSRAGVSLGGLELSVTDDAWTAVYDGVGQLTTIDALARAPQGSSGPMRRLKFDIDARAAAPQWDMLATGAGRRFVLAGDTHVQQGFRTTGSLCVNDEHYWRLDGIGFKDHSSGPRDLTDWYGHRYLQIIAGDYVCHVILMYSPDGQEQAPWGIFHRDGRQAQVTRFELPAIEDSAGGPILGHAVIETDSGEHLEFEAELVHALPMTVTLDNDNINGVDWQIEGNPMVIVEGKGRLTAPDGTVAYCFHERSTRRERCRLPGGRGQPTSIA